MADWKNISASDYVIHYKDAAPTYMSGNVKLTLQYDADSISPTSCKIRFKLDREDGITAHFKDGMYILYNANNDPTDISRTAYKLKGYQEPSQASWPYYSSAITITKTYKAAEFRIQDIWICNIGNGTVDGNELSYNSGTKTFYNWFKSGGDRQNYAYRQSASVTVPINASKTVASAIGEGTVSITDNGDNTFTIRGTKGDSGTNNPVKSMALSWGYSTSYGNKVSNGTVVDLTMTNEANATRTVHAKCWSEATYGDSTTVTTSKAIKQYVKPTKPGTISISYDKSRLTIKEKWVFSWTAPTAVNSNSPIKGYRIRLFKNGSSITIVSSDGKVLTKADGEGSYRYYYDRPDTRNSFTVYPDKNGIKPGDKIKLDILAYTENGKGEKLFSERQTSKEWIVQNAGSLNVKKDGAWKEGQVHVKKDGKWYEAVAVYVKKDGAWHESE